MRRMFAPPRIDPSGPYSTMFDATEDPISEGGKWVNGQAVGGNWSNVQTGAGNAYGSRLVDFGGVPRYADPIAHLSTAFRDFSPTQWAEGIVHRVPGYENASDGHEIELLLRFAITAGNARGYELLWGDLNNLAIVRWNGPLGDYTPLLETTHSALVDGDVVLATIAADNRVRVYKNAALIATGPVDNTFADGQPGIGFWPTPGSTLASYGWKSWTAGDL